MLSPLLLWSVVTNRCPVHLFFSPPSKGTPPNGSGGEDKVTALVADPVNSPKNCYFPGMRTQGVVHHDAQGLGWYKHATLVKQARNRDFIPLLKSGSMWMWNRAAALRELLMKTVPFSFAGRESPCSRESIHPVALCTHREIPPWTTCHYQ